MRKYLLASHLLDLSQMSSNVIPIDPQDLPGVILAYLIGNYVAVAGLSWNIYEYLLTLRLEVEVVWKSRFSLTTILFLINRYAFVLNWSLVLVYDFLFVNNSQSCGLFAVFGDIFNLVNIAAVSGIFILRTYAICAKNRWILAVLIALFSVRFGLPIWTVVGDANDEVLVSIPKVDSIGNCALTSSFKPSAIEIILTVVFDATIFVVTLSRTWTLSRQAKSAGIRGGLGDLLLRDGSLYFGILFVATILNTISVLDLNLPPILIYLTQVGIPLEAILTNRLVLNLRTYDKTNNASSPSTKTDIFFRNAYGGAHNRGDRTSFMDSVLGNIGAPLRVGDENEDEDYIAEGDEGTQGMELVRTQTSMFAGHDERDTPMQPNIRTTDGMEGITVGMRNGDEGTAQASGELHV